MKPSSRVLKQVDPDLKIVSGKRRNRRKLDFQSFRSTKASLVNLLGLSDFDDDPAFLVEIDSDPPLKEIIRAPSQPVLESALRRNGLDAKVRRL